MPSTKTLLFGGLIAFFAFLAIAGALGSEPSVDEQCHTDLNACDGNLSAAYEQHSTDLDAIAQLISTNADLNGQMNTCITLRDGYQQDATDKTSQLETCNTDLSTQTGATNDCIAAKSICDANLASNITARLSIKTAFDICDANRSTLSADVNAKQAQITSLLIDNNVLRVDKNMLLLQNADLNDLWQYDMNRLVSVTDFSWQTLKDANVLDAVDTNGRINAVRSYLCYLDANHC